MLFRSKTNSTSGCTDANKTSSTNGGASTAGGAPKNVGTYYVTASTSASTNYSAGSKTCTEALVINKYEPSISINKTSASVDYNSTGNFTATPTTQSYCLGTLTATSASASYVTVANASSGTYGTSASHTSAESGTAKTFYYKGAGANSSATNVTVSYVPTDTTNCNSA